MGLVDVSPPVKGSGNKVGSIKLLSVGSPSKTAESPQRLKVRVVSTGNKIRVAEVRSLATGRLGHEIVSTSTGKVKTERIHAESEPVEKVIVLSPTRIAPEVPKAIRIFVRTQQQPGNSPPKAAATPSTPAQTSGNAIRVKSITRQVVSYQSPQVVKKQMAPKVVKGDDSDSEATLSAVWDSEGTLTASETEDNEDSEPDVV